MYDASGEEFVHRGVNMPLAYFKEASFTDIEKVANSGFNSVRLLWCADTFEQGGRCDKKDMHSVEDLDRYLSALELNNLVAVLNLQNATGRNDEWALSETVKYLLKPEVKEVLNKHKKNLQINIANEWHGKWANVSSNGKTWFDAYAKQIKNIRDAGLDHQLIVDTCGWGQDPSCVYNYGEELLKVDNNVVFSAHVYDSLGDSEYKLGRMYHFVRHYKIPFIVGEFASTHYGNEVKWQTVINESRKENSKYGYIAWSWSGNNLVLET